MAFNGLAQELPPPQFVQEGSTPSFPDRSSFQSCQEALLRRENVADYSGLQQNRPSYIAKDYIAKDQGNDTKTINNNKVCEKIGGPTWLSNAVIRQQSAASFLDVESNRKWCGCEAGAHCVHSSFLHLQTQRPANPAICKSSPSNALGRSQWLSPPTAIVDKEDQHAATLRGELLGEEECMVGSTELNHSPVQRRDLHSDTANSSELVDATETTEYEKRQENWQTSRLKADILLHPLYEQFLAAHVGCLRIATPVDHIPKIDEQLGQAQRVTAKHLALGNHRVPIGEEKDQLDQFMTHYLLLLCSFKEQLQQHVRVHAMEAVMACWEIEQNLIALTGVTPGTEGTGATTSDDDNDDQEDSDPLQNDLTLDGHDNGGFGPLVPTETERSLMERVRQELKAELKQGYKDRIVDVREEILRKRRAGKLPGDTTSVLKFWWHAHSKWPYPTEDEKARLVQETGLQLKQINNWFINQRKRNWHTNPSSSSSKTKRKRGLNDAPSR